MNRPDIIALSAKITLLEEHRRQASADRLAVNPDDDAAYDAACDRYDQARAALEKAYREFHAAWAMTHRWDPTVEAAQ